MSATVLTHRGDFDVVATGLPFPEEITGNAEVICHGWEYTEVDIPTRPAPLLEQRYAALAVRSPRCEESAGWFDSDAFMVGAFAMMPEPPASPEATEDESRDDAEHIPAQQAVPAGVVTSSDIAQGSLVTAPAEEHLGVTLGAVLPDQQVLMTSRRETRETGTHVVSVASGAVTDAPGV
jgi:hypothetical protein